MGPDKKAYVILKAGEAIGLQWASETPVHKNRSYVLLHEFVEKLIIAAFPNGLDIPEGQETYLPSEATESPTIEDFLEKVNTLTERLLSQSPPPLEGLKYYLDLKHKGISVIL